MNYADQIAKLKSFSNEREFREFLMIFLRKMGFKNVQLTHQYGNPELGKDIIGQYPHSLEGDEWYSFVVKHGKVSGNTTEVETIKDQIAQSFEYTYEAMNGDKIKISKVKVVTNEHFSQGARTAISNSPKLKAWNNFDFWGNNELIGYINDHYSDFWLPGEQFIKTYSRELGRVINEEFELKELSLRIEDKHVQKLIDIFIEPFIIETQIEDSRDKQKLKKKKISVNAITESSESFVIEGDVGSGKSKTLNNIIKGILESPTISEDKLIPVKIKAKDLRASDFDLKLAILNIVKKLSNDDFPDNFDDYKLHLFVDEVDLLTKQERDKLFEHLSDFCTDKHRFVVSRRRNNSTESEKSIPNLKTVRIQNFNIGQIKTFVGRFFGPDKSQRFIDILTESNILQKLPTTPLTITLLSLLFDTNNYEIPATLTDIYTDFTSVLLGKLEIHNRTDLIIYNIRRRIFTRLALKMLVEKRTDMDFSEFEENVNGFLVGLGYQRQEKEEIINIIENSGLLYFDEGQRVGFKQQAFIEYLASDEIYDHARDEYYNTLLERFNDVTWQSAAIFFAGRSKDLPSMIPNLLQKMTNNTLDDWFITTGGMGYLAQALYQTQPSERKKLVLKSLENLIQVFDALKEETKKEAFFLHDASLPMLAIICGLWFIDNFKSITLKQTLLESFDELLETHKEAGPNDFYGDFKMFMVAATLLNRNIGDDSRFDMLLERGSFTKNPVLMIVGESYLEVGEIDRNNPPANKSKLEKTIRQYAGVIKYIIKEPAYRISSEYRLISNEELTPHDEVNGL